MKDVIVLQARLLRLFSYERFLKQNQLFHRFRAEFSILFIFVHTTVISMAVGLQNLLLFQLH